MRKLARYQNGNYTVTLYEDGTKIRENDLDNLTAEFPESFDLKITNYCEMGCPMCHEMSSKEGKHSNVLNEKFIETMHPGTEVAIGGGMVTSYPDLEEFLMKLKKQKVFPSITVHQEEYKKNKEFIKSLIDRKLIWGLGVSFSTIDYKLWDEITSYPNSVAHVIAGYHSLGILEYLRSINAKVLVLGFKNWGRGNLYLDDHPEIYNKIKEFETELFDESKKPFKVLSFDNLALSQLNVRSHYSEEVWNECFQGEDGNSTMYIDAVEMKYALTSTSRERYSIGDLSVQEMFQNLKSK